MHAIVIDKKVIHRADHFLKFDETPSAFVEVVLTIRMSPPCSLLRSMSAKTSCRFANAPSSYLFRVLSFGLAAILALLCVVPVAAQTDPDRVKNLTNCLSGRYPSLCQRSWLNADELKKVEAAERRENLKTCMAGRYPSLCKRSLLTSDEAQEVARAEQAENLKTCLGGRYPSLCKKSLLTAEQTRQVAQAEQAENLKTCLTGRYPSLCKKALLSSEQLAATETAEKQATAQSKQLAAVPSRSKRSFSSGCESGHWVDSVAANGEIVKLEDGSIWQVDAGDTVDSSLWLATTDIVACDDKLINTEDNETVGARRIK